MVYNKVGNHTVLRRKVHKMAWIRRGEFLTLFHSELKTSELKYFHFKICKWLDVQKMESFFAHAVNLISSW